MKKAWNIFKFQFLNISEILFVAKLANWFSAIPVKIPSDIYIFEETGNLIVKFI